MKSVLFVTALCFSTVAIAQHHTTVSRYQFGAFYGLNYNVVSGKKELPFNSVFTRQNDATLNGFRYTNSFSSQYGVCGKVYLGKSRRHIVDLTLELYNKKMKLEQYDFNVRFPVVESPEDNRVYDSKDIQSTLLYGYKINKFKISAGVRISWYSNFSEVSYDGGTELERNTIHQWYDWRQRQWNPTGRITYELNAIHGIFLAPWIGAERRGWTKDVVNYCDLEAGVQVLL